MSEGEKMSQKWPISNLNYDSNTFRSPDILIDPESQHPGFSESVKILGAQIKMWVRENTDFFILLKIIPDSPKPCCFEGSSSH